jgi:hypothetical protein
MAKGEINVRSKRPVCPERCELDFPGFKNLEGLPIVSYGTAVMTAVRGCFR